MGNGKSIGCRGKGETEKGQTKEKETGKRETEGKGRKGEKVRRGGEEVKVVPCTHKKRTRYHTISSGGVVALRDSNMQMLVPLLLRGKTSSSFKLKFMSASMR